MEKNFSMLDAIDKLNSFADDVEPEDEAEYEAEDDLVIYDFDNGGLEVIEGRITDLATATKEIVNYIKATPEANKKYLSFGIWDYVIEDDGYSDTYIAVYPEDDPFDATGDGANTGVSDDKRVVIVQPYPEVKQILDALGNVTFNGKAYEEPANEPVEEAVNLNPSAMEPEDMVIQMEMDDYDDNGEIKSFDAWDKSVDAYHNKDSKTWVDELHRMERDPDQIDIREPDPVYTHEPMTHDDELEMTQNAMKKYQLDRARRIAKQNAERDLFNLDFED